MIPSSPRRTLLFMLLSSLAYFAPDLLAPAAWAHSSAYPVLSTVYQCVLVVAGFWLGPAICRILVVREIGQGSLFETIEKQRAGLINKKLTVPPVVLFDHPAPFILTVGLLPNRCEVFLSAGLANRLSAGGVKFLLARAAGTRLPASPPRHTITDIVLYRVVAGLSAFGKRLACGWRIPDHLADDALGA